MSITTHPPKPKRRWYQFSLKTLLIVVTLFTVGVGCIFGWVQNRRQQARENRERVAVVEHAIDTAEAEFNEWGGIIVRDYEELRPQTWLEKQFDDPGGPDDPVSTVKVTGTLISDSPNDGVKKLKQALPSCRIIVSPGYRHYSPYFQRTVRPPVIIRGFSDSN